MNVGIADSVRADRTKSHYGWIMVAVSFLVQCIGFGNQYFNGVLIQPLKDLFHASTVAVLFSTTGILTLMSGLGSPLCGLLMQRYSIRFFMLLALVTVGLGYIGLAYASNLREIAVINGVLFSTGLLTAAIAGNALVVNWFATGRGLAMGLAGAGIYISGMFIPPVGTVLLERLGFSETCLVLAGITFAACPIVRWFVIDSPEKAKKNRSDGGASWMEPTERLAFPDSLRLATVIRQLRFWSIGIISAVFTGIVAAVTANLMPLAESAGVPRHAASYLVSGSAAGGIIGMILFGKLFDLRGQRFCTRLLAVVLIAPCCLFIGNPPYPILMAAVVALGLGSGASVLLPALLATANFGRRGFTVAYGAMSLFLVVLAAAGISGFAYAYDLYGSYDQALKVFLAVLAMLFIAASGLPKEAVA